MFEIKANIKRKKWALTLLFTSVALVFFSSLFNTSLLPAHAANELSYPTFGTGAVKVRLYADYFCPPCRDMAPKIENALTELVKNNVITFSFIDFPTYEYSTMYAKYFLYAINMKKDFNSAMKARNVLIAAAAQGIKDSEKLEDMLKSKNVQFKEFDVKPIFAFYNSQLQFDKIRATPSCIIEQNGKKEIFIGEAEICSAFKKLMFS